MESIGNKNVYICNTIYHLLVSLSNVFLDKNSKNSILIDTNIKDAQLLKKRIAEVCPEINVSLLNDSEFRKGMFFYSKKVRKLFNSLIGEASINIFNEAKQLAFYLHRNKISYTLMEDGYNNLRYAWSVPNFSLKTLISYKVKNKPIWHGYSKYCKKIIVNSKSWVPKDSRYDKFEEKPKKYFLKNLSEKDRDNLLYIFGVDKLHVEDKSLLLLTQPLIEDGIIDGDKIDPWFDMIYRYHDQGYNIYVKIHPRDNYDYSKLPVRIISSNIPAELLDFVVDNSFELGVTYYSTALEFINCVKNREYISIF